MRSASVITGIKERLMYEADLTLFEQALYVSFLTVVILGAFFLGCAANEHDRREEEKRRELEDAAHRAAVDGRQGYRNTDITV